MYNKFTPAYVWKTKVVLPVSEPVVCIRVYSTPKPGKANDEVEERGEGDLHSGGFETSLNPGVSGTLQSSCLHCRSERVKFATFQRHVLFVGIHIGRSTVDWSPKCLVFTQ